MRSSEEGPSHVMGGSFSRGFVTSNSPPPLLAKSRFTSALCSYSSRRRVLGSEGRGWYANRKSEPPTLLRGSTLFQVSAGWWGWEQREVQIANLGRDDHHIQHPKADKRHVKTRGPLSSSIDLLLLENFQRLELESLRRVPKTSQRTTLLPRTTATGSHDERRGECEPNQCGPPMVCLRDPVSIARPMS